MEEKKQTALQKDITDSVMIRIKELQEVGALVIPKNYAIANELKMAFFSLEEVKTADKEPALQVCTKGSIANALLKMCIQGLSVWKGQCCFIAYGNKIKLQRQYAGTIALALRTGKVKDVPYAEIIYDGDVIEYEIKNGRKTITKHIQSFDNVVAGNIVGAYAIVPLSDGSYYTEIMTINQIKKAWAMGATGGNSQAHRDFPDQMAKKTVISRALKVIINSSNDAYLFSEENEHDTELEEIEFTDADVIDDDYTSEEEFIEEEEQEDAPINVEEEKEEQATSPQMLF